MTEKLSRRSFFKLAGGGIAAAVIAPAALAESIIQVPVDFGFTFGPVPETHGKTLADRIRDTLRENASEIRKNIEGKNALLMKLEDGKKVQINIHRISVEQQAERMAETMRQRKIKRHGKVYIDKDGEEKLIAMIPDDKAIQEADHLVRLRKGDLTFNNPEYQEYVRYKDRSSRGIEPIADVWKKPYEA